MINLIGDIPLQEQSNPTLKKFIGLRNIVTDKMAWKYLLLYEIDTHDNTKFEECLNIYNRCSTSFIAYKTKGGFHIVGLTPLSVMQWGIYFQKLQNKVPEYYAGNTLRLSLKEGESQHLEGYSLRFPFIERLANIYFHRFNVNADRPVYTDMPKYSCVFEKYWTTKI